MARIAGVDIPNDKQVAYSLTYIYGIGLSTAKKILAEVKVDPTVRVKDLSDEQLTSIRHEVAKYKTEGDLRREVALNIKRLQEIGCYRGLRHRKVYQFVDKEPKTMLVHVKDQERLSQIRKLRLNS